MKLSVCSLHICFVNVLRKVVCVFVGDHRLSLMLSQAVGSQYCRDLLALQLSDWNRMQTDSFIDEGRLKIFALLAGKPVSNGNAMTSMLFLWNLFF